MIDIHTHILPNVDDGARDLDEALAMARLAVEDGTRHIIATPHNIDWEATGRREEMTDRVRALQSAMDAAGIALHVYLGSEVRIVPDLVQRMKQGWAMTLNGSRYMLVELPFLLYPPYTERVCFELALEGITPVLAHAERYSAIQEEPETVAPLVERGNLIQITSGSLFGVFGKKAQQAAISLLDRGLVHIIASDAHNTKTRPPLLSQAVNVAAEYVGAERAAKMVNDVPQAILDNAPITVELPPPPPPPSPPRRRWFGRW